MLLLRLFCYEIISHRIADTVCGCVVSSVSVLEVNEPPQAGCDRSIGQSIRTAASVCGGEQSRFQVRRTAELDSNSRLW